MFDEEMYDEEYRPDEFTELIEKAILEEHFQQKVL